ncbi:EAL domain-containing protein [Pseudomonas sp. MAG002Y]|uniref:bifunctional diguanylate cyclase/phosphodiesterase n=1 Tax=Pseudomonas sp. MAG002Y TaxID=2678690 RepID=UPI001C60D067|nr:EAL domain-containing protein [Pseudomonas sp. MAG002Y]MBW5413597.1 EAL domain-containing protein [Pseudomonas sp. MAG002Y]
MPISPPPPAMKKDEPFRSQSHTELTHRSVLMFTVLMLSLFALAGAVTSYIAWSLDSQAVTSGEQALRNAIDARKKSTVATLMDYARWDENFTHLYPAVDTKWAREEDKLAGSLLSQYGLDAVLVVDGSQNTRYAFLKDTVDPKDALQWIEGDLPAMLERLRGEPPLMHVQGFFQVEGAPAIVSAALVQPAQTTYLPRRDQLPILLFVERLDQPKLASIGAASSIVNLKAGPAEKDSASLIISENYGVPFLLSWHAERPGGVLLSVMLPLLVLTAFALYLVLIKLKRRSLRAAALIDSSHEALAHSEARFRDVAEASSNWIWETNARRELTYLSDRFAISTGFGVHEWLGKPLQELIDFSETDFQASAQQDQEPAGVPKALECFYMDRGGHKRVGHLYLRSVWTEGVLSGFRGTLSDITDEMEAQAHYEHLSKYDPLTQLPNRTYMYRYLKEQLGNGPTPESPLTIFYLDLDDFKHVNDTQGHGFGDKVLIEVANRLKRCMDSSVFIARQGGDEFVLVLTGQKQPNTSVLAECLLACLSAPIMIDELEVRVSASIGIVQAPAHGVIKSELLRFADIALYEAKGAGRDTWRLYDSAMNERLLQRQQIEEDLRAALQRDELRLVFQPRFSIQNGNIIGAEALVRWSHPTRGLLSPAVFIPVAEQSGLVVPLSDWVLRKACREALEWKDPIFVSVNLSCIEFQRNDLVERIRQVLEETQLEPARLELEITESVMLDNAESALALMHELKALGVKLSMDDFGTGYSSLSYLSQYPFDGIKIDRSFVMSLSEGDDSNQAIIKAIVALGKALSMSVTAEGVETAEQLNALGILSCDQAQGFLLGRPVPVERLVEQLNEQLAPEGKSQS